MSFRTWFKQWVRAFIRLLSFDKKQIRSKAEKKKEYERKLKVKRSGRRYFLKEKRRRQSSLGARNHRLITGMLNFAATTLAVLLVPLGLLDWGRKSARARKASRGSRVKKEAPRNTSTPPKATPKAPMAPMATKKTVTQKPTPPKAPIKPQEITATRETRIKKSDEKRERPVSDELLAYSASRTVAPADEKQTVLATDKNTPKSTPKNEKDQYIRRRMMIEGSEERSVLDTLALGSYIELELEAEDPCDKDAVKLLYHGKKIGYIAKQDRLSFATCLRLGRDVYGVITAVIQEDGRTGYEYETWFASK